MPPPFIAWRQVKESGMIAYVEEKMRALYVWAECCWACDLTSTLCSVSQVGLCSCSAHRCRAGITTHPMPFVGLVHHLSSKPTQWDNQHHQVHLNFPLSESLENSGCQSTVLCQSAVGCSCPLKLTDLYSVATSMPPHFTGWFCSH